MILTYLVAVNGFIGMITFKPKFLEQIYGQSASKAIFLIGTDKIRFTVSMQLFWREVWLQEKNITWNLSTEAVIFITW